MNPHYVPNAPMVPVVTGMVVNDSVPANTVQNEGNLREYLTMKGWPEAMQTTFIKNLETLPFRFFICDDSGSMSIEDGKISIEYNGQIR